MAHIVKRSRHSEPFSRDKLHRSVVKSCLSTRTPIGEAIMTAEHVCLHVVQWLAKREEVTSADIRRKAHEILEVHNPDAATVYEQFDVLA